MNLKLMQLKAQFKMYRSLKVKEDKNIQAFFELVKAGLFPVQGEGIMVNGSFTKDIDWGKVYQLAQEQSVQGLVLAGMEHSNVKPPQELLLQWIGDVQMIEKRNLAMNNFIAKLFEKLLNEDVNAILVKGQGIAQCYERPLWRVSGDVDLLFNDSNYERAKDVLIPLAEAVEHEFKAFKHLGMKINGFEVELHGSLHTRLSKRIERGIDEVQENVFYGGKVRSLEFMSSSSLKVQDVQRTVQVYLPAPDNDVIFIFTHILHHYFIDGIGLRQICDWCRLLWTYRSELNLQLLESRIRKMGLMSEWKAFGAFAVDYLEMPVETMPFYDSRFKVKGERIFEYVLESGNFGHNKKRKHSDSYIEKKILALWHKYKNFRSHLTVFPFDTIKFFCGFVLSGLDAASRKE